MAKTLQTSSFPFVHHAEAHVFRDMGTLRLTTKGETMIWLQIVLVAWGTMSVALLAVLSASFRAAAGYDRWATAARRQSETLLREAA